MFDEFRQKRKARKEKRAFDKEFPLPVWKGRYRTGSTEDHFEYHEFMLTWVLPRDFYAEGKGDKYRGSNGMLDEDTDAWREWDLKRRTMWKDPEARRGWWRIRKAEIRIESPDFSSVLDEPAEVLDDPMAYPAWHPRSAEQRELDRQAEIQSDIENEEEKRWRQAHAMDVVELLDLSIEERIKVAQYQKELLDVGIRFDTEGSEGYWKWRIEKYGEDGLPDWVDPWSLENSDDDEDLYVTFKPVRARRHHSCTGCGAGIYSGTKYYRGGSRKLCRDCFLTSNMSDLSIEERLKVTQYEKELLDVGIRYGTEGPEGYWKWRIEKYGKDDLPDWLDPWSLEDSDEDEDLDEHSDEYSDEDSYAYIDGEPDWDVLLSWKREK